MRNPDDFEAFYKDARDRLLVQTYALTGDLPASRSAVRDSFVLAWHHWRKVSRLEDREAWIRPQAWAHAQRRHTARIWHRDKGLDPELRATLDALGKLPISQRRILVLSQLASVSLAQMARELGMTKADAEGELQRATSRFAVLRQVSTTSLRPHFDALRAHVGEPRWPRPTIIRRAGTARRRTHTAVGAVAAVAALVVSGVLVTDAAGLRPTLSREHHGAAARAGAAGGAGRAEAADRSVPARPEPAPETLPESAMLTAPQVAAATAARGWQLGDTNDNTGGDGLVLPCQQERYADPKGTAALLRTFETPHHKGAPAAAAYQLTEVSASSAAAGKTYDQTLGWYAGCTDPRVQLLSTHRVGGVGDRAMLLVLRGWTGPSTMVVGVAQTGRLTTTALSTAPGTRTPDLGRAAHLLATAVDGLCKLPDGGTCAGRPTHTTAPPVPVGEVPGMLSEVDLPPVTGVRRPWVGTRPRQALTNVAATGCDRADFHTGPVTNGVTRAFVIPGAKLPDAFGLTETVGTLPAARAHKFVEQVRSKMTACPDKDLGTDVTLVARASTRKTDLSVWNVRTEINAHQTVEFLMGIARNGTAVGQVGFVPSPRFTMAPGAFPALVRRALERLPEMPAPRHGPGNGG